MLQIEPVLKNLILLGIAGSKLYGTDTANSDTDYVGIFSPGQDRVTAGLNPIEYYDFHSWNKEKKSTEGTNFWDRNSNYIFLLDSDFKLNSLKKFLLLAVANNPNILELLYLPEKLYVLLTEKGKELIKNRDIFLSQKCYSSFSGYAYSQLKRVESHRKWLLDYKENPDIYSQRPKASDYIGEEYSSLLDKEELNAYHYFLYSLIEKYSHLSHIAQYVMKHANIKNHINRFYWPEELDAQVQFYTKGSKEFTTLVRRTHEYNTAVKSFEDFQSWKNNRNSKRGIIEQKCGYDGHHLHHCVRLMKMGVEILRDKTLIPNRKDRDAEFLIQIKQGELSYEEIILYIEQLKLELEQAKSISPLPKEVDINLVEDLYLKLC